MNATLKAALGDQPQPVPQPISIVSSLASSGPNSKRRVTLMGLSFLLGVSLGAGGSVAMEMPPVPVHDYWQIDTGKSCHKTPRSRRCVRACPEST